MYPVQSKISPKSSWSLWICITISRGLCQHVQLPLKISMQPASRESTTALQHPVLLVSSRPSAHPSTVLAHLPFHLQHLTLTDKDEDERTARVKGSSLNLIKINFTMSFDCDSLHIALMSYSAWLGFMNTRVEWSQNCDLPANYVLIKFSKALCSISNMHRSPSLIDLYTHNALISKQVLLVVSAQSVIVVYLYTQFIFFRQITLYLAKTQLKKLLKYIQSLQRKCGAAFYYSSWA